MSRLEARVLVCAHCGAPLPVTDSGGQVTCAYCAIVSTVGERPFQARPLPTLPDAATEAARQKRLRAQLTTSRDSRYSVFHRPEGLDDIDGMDTRAETRERLVEAFRVAITLMRKSRNADLEHRVFWIAMRIKNLDSLTGSSDGFVPFLQAASEQLQEAGYRQILLCELAYRAIAERRLEDAEGWLAQCDPASQDLLVDNAVRASRVFLALRREAYDEALALLGRDAESVAVAEEHIVTFGLDWIYVLEELGEREVAESQLLALVEAKAAATAAANVGLVGTSMTFEELQSECRRVATGFVAGSVRVAGDTAEPLANVWRRVAVADYLPPLDEALATLDGQGDEDEPDDEAARDRPEPHMAQASDSARLQKSGLLIWVVFGTILVVGALLGMFVLSQ